MRATVEIPTVDFASKFIRRNLLACFINIAASSLGLCQQRV
jgi:dynactin complex subunit